MTKFKSDQRKNLTLTFPDRRQQGPIRSVLLVIGWLVRWLVGNAVFSGTALRIFRIYCIKLGNIKVEKSQRLIFEKKFSMWRYWQKGPQISPRSGTLIFGLLVGW